MCFRSSKYLANQQVGLDIPDFGRTNYWNWIADEKSIASAPYTHLLSNARHV